MTLALTDTRAVIVVGARQVGKSTLVHAVTRHRASTSERRLDRVTDREAAHRDPERFVQAEGLLVIDEVQRAPELMLAIKARVDEDNRPGQFLLTGSARLLGLRSLPDTLVGRSETIELWPFSQGEVDGTTETFVDTVFSDAIDELAPAPIDRSEYVDRALRGGYPEAVQRLANRRRRFFESYVNDLIDRDVMQLTEIQRRPDLHRLLAALAARMASPLNVEGLASEVGLPRTTVDRYIALFEEVFLVKRIPAWSSSVTRRANRASKLLVVDSGLASSLSGLSIERAQRNPVLAGPLIENFVISEIGRQLTWADTAARLYHYRTRDGQEVDAVLEAADGRLVGIEVKAASAVRAEDFRHLEHLQRLTGARFEHGLVLYTGPEPLAFGDRLTALPISGLWAERRSRK